MLFRSDFELAAKVGDPSHASGHRTGTAPFMAREVLKGFESGYRHTLNHDLESVYYVACWHVVGYRGYKLPGTNSDPLNGWWSGSFKEMYRAKEEHMSEGSAGLLKQLGKDRMSIEILNYIRCLYRERAYKIDDIRYARNRKNNAIIDALVRQAFKDGLSMEERTALSGKRRAELGMEVESRRFTLAVSFKEWLKGAWIFLREDKVMVNCKCDSCCDALAEANIATSGLQQATTSK